MRRRDSSARAIGDDPPGDEHGPTCHVDGVSSARRRPVHGAAVAGTDGGHDGRPQTRHEVARNPDMTQPTTGVGVQSSASMMREPTIERETP